MFSRFHAVKGFSFPEVLICFSIVMLAFSFSECFVRGFDAFPKLIKSGELDRILVRPRGEMFQVLTSNLDISRFGRFFQAVVVLIYAVLASGVSWTCDKILTLAAMFIGGCAVYSGLFMLYAGISFFTIESLEFMNIFTHGSREFGSYPLSIYGNGILKFFTYVVPVALFQYYPLLYLIGRTDNAVYCFLPFIGFVFMIPCYAFFRFGLSRYKSTGS